MTTTSEGPAQLWCVADIAEELEVGLRTVRRWVHEGRYIPEPHWTTRAGIRLWTPEQVKQIVASYHARPTVRGRRYGSRANEKRSERR